MNEEPIYVDAGDEFDIEDNSWKYPDDLENRDIIKKVFSVCGRKKYFKSKREHRRWKQIDGQISRGVIPVEWVNSCIKWAADRNAQTRGIAIKVDNLATAVLNKARMQDWINEHRGELIDKNDYSVEDLYK
jgi:hypothetical protein